MTEERNIQISIKKKAMVTFSGYDRADNAEYVEQGNEEKKMYQGQELYEKLSTIYEIMSRYARDTESYFLMLRKIRSDKQYIETKSAKGKINLTAATGITFLVIHSLLYGLFGRDFESAIAAVIALVVYITCKNIYPKVSKIAFGFLIFLVIFQMIGIVRMALDGVWGGVVLLVISLPVAIWIIRKALKVNRSYVDSYNEEVQQYNMPYIKKYQKLYAECQELEEQLRYETTGWYPPDYVNMDAVCFFINALINGKASTMSELVNLYDNQLRHNEIVRNQREQIELTRYGIESFLESQRSIEEQLRYNNMLGLFQVFQLYDIQRRL